MSDFKIPIEDKINDFEKHLQANPRTILSSKFGDGKSFFLNELKGTELIKEKYEFITIYPVNYQVATNKDIFEILKRDILFQLLLHGMINNRVQVTKAEAFSWFLKEKGTDLFTDIVSYLSEVGFESDACTRVIMAMKGLKLFKSYKDKLSEFLNKEINNEEYNICRFLDKIDSSFVYECDFISNIIRKSIAEYKIRTNKKVVLIIEDLDRIDPAHTFRILNILSAHMDYGYKNLVKPDDSLAGNKFGMDGIVLVVDFDNLRNIYHHFYGIHTDFNGYISKFLSSIPFYYSLESLKTEYILNKLVDITNLPPYVLEKLFAKDILLSATMREIVHSFIISKQIKKTPTVKIDKKNITLNDSMLKAMSVMRRMKIIDEDIVRKIINLSTSDTNVFIEYVCPYLFTYDNNGDFNYRYFIIRKNSDIKKMRIALDSCTGKASVVNLEYFQRNDKITDLEDCVKRMFNYIA